MPKCEHKFWPLYKFRGPPKIRKLYNGERDDTAINRKKEKLWMLLLSKIWNKKREIQKGKKIDSSDKNKFELQENRQSHQL